jgi:5-methylcytosine-specific restriction protein A
MGKYDPLQQYLESSKEKSERLSFSQLTIILKTPLPESASIYRAWWANDVTHTHAKAWLNAGWKVDNVNLGSDVTFIRKKLGERVQAVNDVLYGGTVTKELFIEKLQELFSDEEKCGATSLIVKAGNLHRCVGGYPGYGNRMPVCCAAMRSLMKNGDEILQSPPKGDGANFVIRYKLPR